MYSSLPELILQLAPTRIVRLIVNEVGGAYAGLSSTPIKTLNTATFEDASPYQLRGSWFMTSRSDYQRTANQPHFQCYILGVLVCNSSRAVDDFLKEKNIYSAANSENLFEITRTDSSFHAGLKARDTAYESVESASVLVAATAWVHLGLSFD